jgi:hypothetical protein
VRAADLRRLRWRVVAVQQVLEQCEDRRHAHFRAIGECCVELAFERRVDVAEGERAARRLDDLLGLRVEPVELVVAAAVDIACAEEMTVVGAYEALGRSGHDEASHTAPLR